MALEIERRFFVVSEAWQELSVRQEQLDQGYLSAGQEAVVVRVRRSQQQAWLTLKAPTTDPEIRMNSSTRSPWPMLRPYSPSPPDASRKPGTI